MYFKPIQIFYFTEKWGYKRGTVIKALPGAFTFQTIGGTDPASCAKSKYFSVLLIFSVDLRVQNCRFDIWNC